jgi:uncharacterized protein YjiS (DUF1127 family)
MATTYNPTVAPLGATVTRRAVGALSAMVAAIRKWNDTRRTVAALRQLDAHLLDDIGLTRGGVHEFSRRGL